MQALLFLFSFFDGASTAGATPVIATKVSGPADGKRKKRIALIGGEIVEYESKSQLRRLKREYRERIERERCEAERPLVVARDVEPALFPAINPATVEAIVGRAEAFREAEKQAEAAQAALVEAQNVHVAALRQAAEQAAREALWREMEEDALLLLIAT